MSSLLLSVPFCFFFYWCCAHRDLHSFPTRRSSDLCIPGSSPVFSPIPNSARCGGLPRCRRPTRSEEHTSELQSLTNLVCRLLLEKKNSSTTHAHDVSGATRRTRASLCDTPPLI